MKYDIVQPQCVDVCGRNLGNESGVFQRLQATERRMLRMICGVTLKDKVESTVIASRVGVDELEEHFMQKRLRTKKERQASKTMD